MQLYLQTINVQVKQCNMLRYIAPLKETFKFAQRLSINMPRFHRDILSANTSIFISDSIGLLNVDIHLRNTDIHLYYRLRLGNTHIPLGGVVNRLL